MPDPKGRVQVEVFELLGEMFSRGEQIKVLPSAPRHRDGFVGKVLCATLDEAGKILYVDVFGAPGSKAPSTRSLPPDRLAPMPKPKRRRGQRVAGEPIVGGL